ncbi:hypothetical protein BJ912DRAFT_991827 [Pholiota molesta]|nr:hypothetical protein BJ912DRAFT_991827 [Pholiota molesta]
MFLVIAEFAFFLTEISFNAKYANTNISLALDTKINALLATAYFTSFATTLVTTVLIAYRIHSVSKAQGASSRRFKHIMDIIVQSGVIYALSQFTSALAGVVPGSKFLSNTRDRAFQDYAPLLNLAIAGISSTVMVARVALLSGDATYPSTSGDVSGLQFHVHSTHLAVDIDTMEVTHSILGDRISSGEQRAVEEKAQ